MKTIFWEVLLLAIAFFATWWFFLRSDKNDTQLARQPAEDSLPMLLTPVLEPPSTEVVHVRETVDEVLVEPLSPPPELGTPEGESTLPIPIERPDREEAPEKIEQAPEEPSPELSEPMENRAEDLMQDTELLQSAAEEIRGEARRGFATVLIAAPEDQLDIARFFGEELVLVPRETLDPKGTNPRYFRVDPERGSIETIRAQPPLERFRQYRDLFDYEYARLPRPLRELRKCVLGRSEIFLFAALIPVKEWAVVVGRRGEALALSGRRLSDVRRFHMRYRRRADDGFELVVDQIVFADGERFRPHHPSTSEKR